MTTSIKYKSNLIFPEIMLKPSKQAEASKRKTPDKEKISDVPKKTKTNEIINKADFIVFNLIKKLPFAENNLLVAIFRIYSFRVKISVNIVILPIAYPFVVAYLKLIIRN